MMNYECQEVKEWKQEIQEVESRRKQQNKLPQFQGYVNENDKQSNYNVITQRFLTQQKDDTVSQQYQQQMQRNQDKSQNEPYKKKYFNSYDILNFQKIGDFKKNEEFKVKQFVIPPRQINFNIVTNVLTDESLYKNSTAKFEIPKQTGKRVYPHKANDYDIITATNLKNFKR